MSGSGHDVLACISDSASTAPSAHSTNPIEPLHKGLKRRDHAPDRVILGGSAAILLGAPQDFGLLASLALLILLAVHGLQAAAWRVMARPTSRLDPRPGSEL